MRVKAYFDSVAKELDNAGTPPWADWAWRIVEEEVGSASGCFIVDLGVGTGLTILNLLRFTRNAKFLGVDFSEEMIATARKKDYRGAAVDFCVSRIDELRLPPQSVDHFVSFGTFHHIRNKARVLRNLAEMLRPGGKFINSDLFEPGEAYLAEMRELRRLNPDAAAENDRMRQEFQKNYDAVESHPLEFHVDPYDFKKLLEDSGMGPARVHVSFQPGYAMVVGQKAVNARVGREAVMAARG